MRALLYPSSECNARVITNNPNPVEVVVFKGMTESTHNDVPNREEVAAQKLSQTLKHKALENPGQPPSQIMRNELAGVDCGVLSQLPQREALSKVMRRERRREEKFEQPRKRSKWTYKSESRHK